MSALAVVAAAACAGTGSAGAPATDPAASAATATTLPDTIEIPIGGEARADGGRLAVRFVAVVADSRCPANALCVWEGDASVRLHLRAGGLALDTVLHTRLEPLVVDFAEYRVSIPGVFPYPGTWPEADPPPRASVLVGVARR